jgi:hypothetical protein
MEVESIFYFVPFFQTLLHLIETKYYYQANSLNLNWVLKVDYLIFLSILLSGINHIIATNTYIANPSQELINDKPMPAI